MPDVIFVPMGDTALIRGVAVEAKRRHPDVRIVGVQAEQAAAYVNRGNKDESSLQIPATQSLMAWRHSIRSRQM